VVVSVNGRQLELPAAAGQVEKFIDAVSRTVVTAP
jgi:hypothetical protein